VTTYVLLAPELESSEFAHVEFKTKEKEKKSDEDVVSRGMILGEEETRNV